MAGTVNTYSIQRWGMKLQRGTGGGRLQVFESRQPQKWRTLAECLIQVVVRHPAVTAIERLSCLGCRQQTTRLFLFQPPAAAAAAAVPAAWQVLACPLRAPLLAQLTGSCPRQGLWARSQSTALRRSPLPQG